MSDLTHRNIGDCPPGSTMSDSYQRLAQSKDIRDLACAYGFNYGRFRNLLLSVPVEKGWHAATEFALNAMNCASLAREPFLTHLAEAVGQADASGSL